MGTENQNQVIDNQGAEPEKTFTQEELNSIIDERLKREREKFADYNELKEKATKYDEVEEANKTELEKATERANSLQAELDQLKTAEQLRIMRQEVSEETGVPAMLLTGETKEACMDQANGIKAFAKPNYPSVPDGGEPHGTVKKAAREQFKEWLDSQD